MAALSDNFHDWRICTGTGELCIEMPVIPSVASDEFYRGAILVQAATPTGLKVPTATGDWVSGINEKRFTSVNQAAAQNLPIWVRGVIWFTGVAAIATANVDQPLYCLATSDNPADLTATAAGAAGAVGVVLGIEVTAVSGYIDTTNKSIASNVA